jgi:hypothetical protein
MTLIPLETNNIELVNLSTVKTNVSGKKRNPTILEYFKNLLVGQKCLMLDGYNCKCKDCMQFDLKNIINKKKKTKIVPMYEIINDDLIINEYVFITTY